MVAVELVSEHNYKKAILSSRLESYADNVARTDDYSGTMKLLPENIRVSVVREDGFVIFDSFEPAASMGNHLTRPEIASCLEGRDGCCIRKSETAGISYIYFARKYPGAIIRTALPFEVSQKRFLHPDWMLILMMVLLFVVTLVVIFLLSQRIEAQADRETDERLQSQKRRMTSNIAHEIRTPVTSVRGYLETIVDNPTMSSDKKELFIERAYLQTLRLSDLIRDISLITKIEEAPDLLQKEYLGVRRVYEEVLEEFSSQIRDNSITVENLVGEDVFVKGNQSLIYALLRNLVENSIRYAGEGICIRLECSKSGNMMEFVYSDNGKGVSAEHISHIFERFYRVPEENSHRAEGSGLGLSIVRNAVVFHGGTITASNIQPHGLQFRFTLSEN